MKSLKSVNWTYVLLGFAVTLIAAYIAQMTTKTETYGEVDEFGDSFSVTKTKWDLPFMKEEEAA